MIITLIGLNNYLHAQNDDLFGALTLPEGIDKETLEYNILEKGSEFEVINANPHYLKFLIGIWGKKYYRTFEKWITALNIEYNPLENYDRMESWNDNAEGRHDDSATRGETEQRSDRSVRDNDGSFSNSNTNSGTTTTENTVSAYNSSAYEPKDKSVTTNSATATASGTTAEDETITQNGSTTVSATDTQTGTTANVSSHTGRTHGNIGVTTSQQMLQAELDIARFNLIDQITDLFLDEFCIKVY